MSTPPPVLESFNSAIPPTSLDCASKPSSTSSSRLPYLHYFSHTCAMKFSRSSLNALGCSKAAKCPPYFRVSHVNTIRSLSSYLVMNFRPTKLACRRRPRYWDRKDFMRKVRVAEWLINIQTGRAMVRRLRTITLGVHIVSLAKALQ